MIYGYVRISTSKQNIERQIRNILQIYPKAKIVQEVYTGTKLEDRRELQKLLAKVQTDDTIVFDSVSRFSRNAEEGYKQYETLYNKGVNLIFLKEPYINTETYKQSIKNAIKIETEDKGLQALLGGINIFIKELAKKQIYQAFEQAEKEVKDLQERTKEGLKTARLNGKQIGREEGTKVTTKKSIEIKEKIIKLSKEFKGSLKDKEIIDILGIARNTYYKYKKELMEEITKE